jgi:acyl-homoserine lactone acylase PvdQ
LGADEAWTNLPGGPSESRFSPFYKNDIIRWQSGKYKRLTPEQQAAVGTEESQGGRRKAEGEN